MAREFTFYGKSWEEVQKLSLDDFAQLLPSRQRRTIKRGLPEGHKILIKNIEKGLGKLKTHCRDMIIIPSFVGKTIKIHNGKEFVAVLIEKEMLGHRLGEYSHGCKKVEHSAPGIGATRSSAALSVR